MQLFPVAYRSAALKMLRFCTLSASGLLAASGPPEISVIPDQAIMEEGTTPAIPFTVTAASFTLAGSSSDPLLVPATNIVSGGSGLARTVTVTAAPNRLGAATITINAVGAGGGALTSFQLTVNARLRIDRVHEQTVLTWTATNAIPQQAEQIPSGWRDIFPAVGSPYTVPNLGNHFYRLRQQ
jgi:hypothetical protein